MAVETTREVMVGMETLVGMTAATIGETIIDQVEAMEGTAVVATMGATVDDRRLIY